MTDKPVHYPGQKKAAASPRLTLPRCLPSYLQTSTKLPFLPPGAVNRQTPSPPHKPPSSLYRAFREEAGMMKWTLRLCKNIHRRIMFIVLDRRLHFYNPSHTVRQQKNVKQSCFTITKAQYPLIKLLCTFRSWT